MAKDNSLTRRFTNNVKGLATISDRKFGNAAYFPLGSIIFVPSFSMKYLKSQTFCLAKGLSTLS
ncbi:transmembrane protein, putative [Medicago truncatula]|uniref:Transmembrane protein, putative n=1 Tax=Medicago truncatula TaxID=3880 RepID=A0A072TQ49_MEDTR|nr:transmembrane protein, putative [Medicago truncatula]